jgi:hypothetical protein
MMVVNSVTGGSPSLIIKFYFMKNQFIIIFILLSSSLTAQKISGIVIDKATKKPIPFVSIINDTENKATVTNDEGEFEINISKLPVEFKISHVSYKKVSVEITEYKKYSIELTENVIELAEVATGNRASILLDLAIQKARKDSNVYHYSKVFFQKVAKEGGVTNTIHEIFFEAGWDSYGIRLWNPTDARYAKKESHHSFSNITTFAFLLVGTINKNRAFPNNIFENKENYKYTISGVLNEGFNDEVDIIQCTPIDKKMSYFDGKIYINSTYDNIMKIEGVYYQKQDRSIDKISFKNNFTNLVVNFKEDESHRAYFQSAELTYNITMHYALIASRKFIERVKIIAYEDVKHFNNLKSSYVRSDLDLIKKTTYNKLFWSDNPVLKNTPILEKEIRGFEENRSFGNYFDK